MTTDKKSIVQPIHVSQTSNIKVVPIVKFQTGWLLLCIVPRLNLGIYTEFLRLGINYCHDMALFGYSEWLPLSPSNTQVLLSQVVKSWRRLSPGHAERDT